MGILRQEEELHSPDVGRQDPRSLRELQEQHLEACFLAAIATVGLSYNASHALGLSISDFKLLTRKGRIGQIGSGAYAGTSQLRAV